MIADYSARDHLKEVATISADASVGEAAKLMAGSALGCLVVVDAEGLAAGVVTDRDLAVRVVGRSLAPADTRVEQVMSAPVIGVAPDTGLSELVRTMQVRGVRRLVVLEDGRASGLVALDDLLLDLAMELSDLSEGVRMQLADSERDARLESRRRDVASRIEDLRMELRKAGWWAREELLGEIDHLREELRSVVGGR
jgi:CBS domain-containing protein